MSKGRKRWRFVKDEEGKPKSEEIKDDEEEITILDTGISQQAFSALFGGIGAATGNFTFDALRQVQDAVLEQAAREQNRLARLQTQQLLSDNAELRRQLTAKQAEVRLLEQRVKQLKSISYATLYEQATGSPAEVARELLQLIAKFHPDKNPKGLDATEVTQALNELRDKYLKKNPRGA